MGKLIVLAATGIVGIALAGVTVVGVVSSNTAAPKHNPASAPLVNYGNR